uniref:Uncharacterized protein n=1 Tax=Rhizophora mucronata TaxID=61149 RepID=A0A2P2QKF0_RHIMU
MGWNGMMKNQEKEYLYHYGLLKISRVRPT